MADAFDVLNTSLGPALNTLDRAANRNVLMATQNDRRAYDRMLMEDERKYAEATEQRRRTERKEDADEVRLRDLKLRLAAVGGDPTGKTEEQIAKEITDLSLRQEIKRLGAMDQAKLNSEAIRAGVTTEGKTPGQIVDEIASKNQDRVIQEAVRGDEMLAEAARKSPDWERVKSRYAAAQAARAKVLTEVTAPLPEFNPGMSEETLSKIGQAIVMDPTIAKTISQLPNGDRILAGIKAGQPGALNALRSPDIMNGKASLELAQQVYNKMDMIQQQFDAAGMEQYKQEVDMWIARARNAGSMLLRANQEVDSLESDKIFGRALVREDGAKLGEDFLKKMYPGPADKEKFSVGLPGLPPPSPQAAPHAMTPQYVPEVAAPPMPVTQAPVSNPVVSAQAPNLTAGQWMDKYLWPAPQGSEQGTPIGATVDRILQSGRNTGNRLIDIVAPAPRENLYVEPYLPVPTGRVPR